MTHLDDARLALVGLNDLTKRIKDGSPPDPHSVLGYMSDLVRLYSLIGEDMAQRFGAKERSYLNRKIAQAKEHAKGRVTFKSSKDAEEAAFLAVGEEYQREIDAMQEFELYRVMLRSIQNAIDFSRTMISFLKASEANA